MATLKVLTPSGVENITVSDTETVEQVRDRMGLSDGFKATSSGVEVNMSALAKDYTRLSFAAASKNGHSVHQKLLANSQASVAVVVKYTAGMDVDDLAGLNNSHVMLPSSIKDVKEGSTVLVMDGNSYKGIYLVKKVQSMTIDFVNALGHLSDEATVVAVVDVTAYDKIRVALDADIQKGEEAFVEAERVALLAKANKEIEKHGDVKELPVIL